jgi:predicted N-acetyltransferase YhbS
MPFFEGNEEIAALNVAKTDVKHFVHMRLSHEGDDEAIRELLVLSFLDEKRATTLGGFSLELLEVVERRKTGDVIILEHNGRLIGTISVISAQSPQSQSWMPNAAYLRFHAIDPEFHGLGLSELLLAECEERARRMKASAICLHIQKGAEGLARFYQSFGYERAPQGDLSQEKGDAYILDLKQAALQQVVC